jgi:hypothetical protein
VAALVYLVLAWRPLHKEAAKQEELLKEQGLLPS